MKQSFRNMGISILSGSITTLGSSLFLFGGVLLPFYKFATIISTTIAASYLTSMLLFGALMNVYGPENG